MEFNKYLPSKTFRMRALIAGTLLLLAYLISLLTGVGDIGYRKIGSASPQTVGDILVQDTDEDGVPDWEERLWGTDPFQKNSNTEGIDDKTYIEKLREANPTESILEENNQTDLLAQDISILTTALQLNTGVSSDLSEKIAQSVTSSLQQVTPEILYTKDTLQSVTVSNENRRNYAQTFERIIRKYIGPYTLGKELEILAITLESQEDTLLPELTQISNGYTLFAKELSTIQVPEDIHETHLSFINALHNLGVTTKNFNKVFSDPVVATQAIVQYRAYNTTAEESVAAIEVYFKNNGILR